MAKAQAKFKLDVQIDFSINEQEALALEALSGYGADAFVKAFYEQLGSAYMLKHEAGLREFLTTIREVITPALAGVKSARESLKQPR